MLTFSGLQELFEKVVPFQCLGCVWSQRDKKENLAPTIRATVAQFNTVTNRVITSLLCSPVGVVGPTIPLASSPAQRARIIEKWISVAQVSVVAGGGWDALNSICKCPGSVWNSPVALVDCLGV